MTNRHRKILSAFEPGAVSTTLQKYILLCIIFAILQGVTFVYSDDSRRNYLFINGINPPDSSSSTNLPLVIYDILNYKGIPTNIIAAYVNNFFASGISTSGFGSYDVIRTYNGTTSDKINLPSTIPYSDGQVKNQTNGSSAESYFGYNLNNQNTNFYLWPQIKI